MNEDNQYPNQNENSNQGPNPNNDGNTNAKQFSNENQNGDFNQSQNQNEFVDSNQGQYSDQDKYWNPNQTQNSTQNHYSGQNQSETQQNQNANSTQNVNPTQFANQNPNPNPKKPKSNKLVVTIITAVFALLVVGGGAFAFFNMQKSPKDTLLAAELNSWKQISKVFESRYQPELDWANKAETTPTEYTYEIGASVDGDFYNYEDMMAAEIINNSSLSVGIQMDQKNQIMKASLGADVNGVQIDDFTGYITTEKVMVGFPFTDDILQLKDEDYGKLNRLVDPYYEGSETMGLSNWMGKNIFSEENKKYLVKEYLLFFYNSIPSEAFEETSEEINVFGEKLQANKITMELSGDQIKDILVKVLEKAKDDPKFEEIIFETVKNVTGAAHNYDDVFDVDFNEGLENAIEELKETDFQTGINYTVWVSSDVIAQSELVIGEFKIEGTRQITNEQQKWDYILEFEGEKLTFAGDLSSKNGKFDDEIKMLAEDGTGIIYEGTENLDGSKRTFDRTINFLDTYDEIALSWVGDSSYAGDSMESSHTFGVETYEFDIDVTVDETGTLIKNIDIPEDNIVDLGAMSEEEIQTYLQEEFLYEAQSWFMGLYLELGLY